MHFQDIQWESSVSESGAVAGGRVEAGAGAGKEQGHQKTRRRRRSRSRRGCLCPGCGLMSSEM